MPSSILSMSIDKTNNIPIIVGNTSSFDVSIKNISSNQRLYNLGITLTLPNGMSLSSASINQTSSFTNSDNSITYTWVNIKDLAPMELDFKFSITVSCNTKFKNGNLVPFGYNFSGINVSCQTDTMPRGIYDNNNEVIISQIAMTYVTIRFSGTIITSNKVLKGAGTSASMTDYTQVTTATCKFTNNSTSTSLVNITLLLDDGIRYIGNISVSGTDASKFISPSINIVSIDGKLYTQIYFGNINLSINSITTLVFSYAVWNRYKNNTGNLISHGTKLNMSLNMASADSNIVSSYDNNFSFSAMDVIITTSISKSIVDVQTNITYTYLYKVGQYYSLQNIIVHYFLPDGIYYLSSSSIPTSVVNDSNLQGYYITYNYSSANPNSIKSVTISAKVDSYYRYKFDSQSLNLPVVASDPFFSPCDITATLVGLLNTVTDNAGVNSNIGIGTITKQFIKGYYKDGTPKTINSLAPGDYAEYLLSYNATSLKAIQKQIYLDDFFPLSSDPINNLTYAYTGISPASSPQLISPHGVDFYYGDIPGLSSGTINFKVQIASLGASTQNTNLMKLKGINTYGNSYSSRAQVNFNIGTPNLTLTKTVVGPNKNAIQANELYSYTVTISNSNNLGTETDAFDFTLNDTLSSSWFTLDQSSIKISGSGSFNSPTVQGNNIVLYINKLSPGNSLTLTYNVIISSTLAPGITINTTATTTNPYSQIYNVSSTNFQYSNLNKSASVTLSSLAITLIKTNYNDNFKVGSLITYKLSLTIPKGTIAYGLYVKDTLPTGNQVYLGPSFRNDILINPSVSSNVVTFPNEGTVDARLSSQTISYIFTAKINNATKNLNTITSTQTNTMQCLYQTVQSGAYSTITKTLVITINHPNMVLNLSATDKTTNIIYNSTANINTNSLMQFKLIFQNNSTIDLINGTIEIPLDSNLLFYSIDTTVLCSASYNALSKKIVITVPKLSPSMSGYITFTEKPMSNLRAGTTINTQATAVSYYNDISTTKVYGGEKSNILSFILQPNVSLSPNPIYKIDDSTAFIITPPGNTAIILDYFKNTGGGYDDFTIKIAKVGISYSLYIDDIKVADVSKNTLYSADLQSMSNLAPNTSKVIKITALIPLDDNLGTRYDFIVTVQSKTSPYPQSTVLNIDPHPF